MKWFQLFKTHKFVNDMDERLDAHGRKTADLEANKEAEKQEIRAVFESAWKEFVGKTAKEAKVQDDAFRRSREELDALVKATRSQVGKWLAEQQAVVTEMLRDAEEIRREVTRQSRRSDEFTAMIDSRCKDIGAKIRETFGGEIQRAADRAVQAATDAKAVADSNAAEFKRTLDLHKKEVDSKLGVIALGAEANLQEQIKALKPEVVAELEKRLVAAPKSRDYTGTRR